MTSRLEQIGPAFRWMRERRSLSQADLAERLGVTASVVSRIESGRQRPSLDSVDRLLAALETDLLELGLALRVMAGSSAVPMTLPDGLSRSERGALAVSFFGFQEFVRAAAERRGDPSESA